MREILDAIVTMSILFVEFALLTLLAWPLIKWLGVDDIVQEIERAHQCDNTNELRRKR